MGSLKEALRDAGLSSSKKRQKRRSGGPSQKAPSPSARSQSNEPSELDLAEAYRQRHLAEKADAQQKKQAKQAEQAARRKRNLQIEALLTNQIKNSEDAEHARYFEQAGRVRRVMCTDAQRKALNEGCLAVVMFRGAAKLVEPQVAMAVAAIAPEWVPDLTQSSAATSDETTQSEEDHYPPVPDDLMW